MMDLLVRCPQCETTYRLKAEKLSRPQVRLRCARCGHVFPYTRAETRRRVATGKREVQSAETPHPQLPFAAEREEEPAAATDDVHREAEPPAKTRAQGEREPSVPSRNDKAEPKAVSKASRGASFQFDEDEDFTLGDEDEELNALPEPEPVAPPKPRPPRKPRPAPSVRDDRGPFRTLVVLLLGCVASYAVYAATLLVRPDRAQALLSSIPLIGGGLGEERLWARRVRLDDVQAGLQQIKGGREVLVVSGKAVNTTTLPLQAVQISAELLGPRGQVLEQKVIFCGNVVSARVLRDLTPQEISLLQQVAPPKQFAIPPGEASPFVVVFPVDRDEQKRPTEFRLRVLAARRQV
jgi:predicted Zn finger-like uncharacterized protein